MKRGIHAVLVFWAFACGLAKDPVRGAPARADAVDHAASTVRLAGLDWIRGAAALWVMVYHVDVTLQKAKYFGLPPLSPFTSVGYRGVELFFLLSGFVMARSYAGRTGGALRDAAFFALRRVLRIFPAYLVVFVPLFVVAEQTGLGAPTSVPVDSYLFLSNLLLLPRDNLTTYIPVGVWTLTHELMFYALFLVAFVSRRAFLALLTAWAVVGLGCHLGGIEFDGWRMVMSPLNGYFLLGVIAYHVVPRRAVVLHAVALPVSLVLLTGAIALEHGRQPIDAAGHAAGAAYATAFFLMVLALGHRDNRLPKPLQGAADYMGKISYCLYLVSYPAIVVLAKCLKAWHWGEHAALLLMCSAVVVSVVLADLLHRLVELPFMSLGKRMVRRSP